MKKLFLVLCCVFCGVTGLLSQDQYDIVRYTAPKDWKMEEQNTFRVFSRIDGGSWSQIAVYKSTVSKGSIEEDAANEWKNIVLSQHTIMEKEDKSVPASADGWQVMSHSGVWQFNGTNVATILTTYSNNEVCVSILCNATAQPYLKDYQNFISTVDFEKVTQQNTVIEPQQTVVPSVGVKDRFKYNTTNFPDGWVSTIQQDWVEVSKGSIRILLHYPKDGTVFPADPAPLTNAVWDILVAPRYSNIKNYKTAYISEYIRQYFGMGYLTENASRKSVFVVLFRRDAGWIECVAPDKETFMREFKFDPEIVDHNSETSISKPLAGMAGYNRFAVAAADIENTGKWSDHFSSNTYYSNYYTGAYAGMSTYSSSQWFEFGNKQSYKWELTAANSHSGKTDFVKVTGQGVFKLVNEWKIHFTSMEGKPRTYDAYFTATKGGRVLWLNDADYPGSGIFTGFTPSAKK